ncbi:transposase [Candidatus Kaiserbacteria bacterium]|nr:transposase [Candidatus Kaiserbacteria bacterium]
MTRQIEFASDELYHIYNRGTEKRIVFLSRWDYDRFLTLLYLCNQEERIDERLNRHTLAQALELPQGSPLVNIVAYCLMPNHFHLVLREISGSGISRYMQKVITGYTMYFNKKYDRSGVLFQGKFKAAHAKDDRYLQYLMAYVHLNPTTLTNVFEKDKLSSTVRSLKQYRYSSYLDYIGTKRPENKLVDMYALPGYLSGPKHFKKHIKEWLDLKLD